MTHRCILLERRAHALIGKNVEGDIYIYNVTGIETLCIECNIVIQRYDVFEAINEP